MRCLIITENECDFTKVLGSCCETVLMTKKEALDADLSKYDSFCILAAGGVLDPRLRIKLENETEQGKHIFTEALNSWMGIYSANPEDTTRCRLIVVNPDDKTIIPGLESGDLLDDCSNAMVRPWYSVTGMKPLLVYKDHIIAHRHLNAAKEDILKDSSPGLWMIGENVMMSSFTLHNFNKARFAPRESWWKLICFISHWLTGSYPGFRPQPVVWFNVTDDLKDSEVFKRCLDYTVERGIKWLGRFLIDGGAGGIREGLKHNIDPDGNQTIADAVRTDCSGEASGAFQMYGHIYGSKEACDISESLNRFILGPMMIKGGMFDGMIRWTDSAWQVCYQDDVARAIMHIMFKCLFTENNESFNDVCRALDFLVRTTAKDGCRVHRTDAPHLDEKAFRALTEAEHGVPSAHYNSYYHAALLLAYKICGKKEYLDVGRNGLETIMSLYPETRREQSETEEMCRLILPLAALYDATHEKKHLQMLYRVTEDLETHRHDTGGYCEWDTGYRAHCSRESRGECSLLTENGDPVADLLYSTNWLPVGFAYAYHVTGDKRFHDMWRNVVSFFIRSQLHSDDPKTDGSWCRAFDMELGEVYGCPHDVGWASCCSESGWTDAEILMGMMLPDYIHNK